MAEKFYKVRHNGSAEFMSGSEVSLLQNSGSKVKVIRKATEKERKQYFKSLK